MSYPPQGYGTYGPDPWRQTSWDARAAGNFIGGGMGGGLIVFTVLADASGAARAALLLGRAGARRIRPLLRFAGARAAAARAERLPQSAHVVDGTRSVDVGAARSRGWWPPWGIPGAAWLALALALVFVCCQARLLQAAKGIPAWRGRGRAAARFTGLAEGAGLFFVAAPWHGAATLCCSRVRRPRAHSHRGLARLSAPGRRHDRAGREGGARRRGSRAASSPARRCRSCSSRARWASSRAQRGGVGRASPGLPAALSGAFVKLVLITRAGLQPGLHAAAPAGARRPDLEAQATTIVKRIVDAHRQRPAPRGRGRRHAVAPRLPARASEADRDQARLRRRGVRRLHGARSTGSPCSRA